MGIRNLCRAHLSVNPILIKLVNEEPKWTWKATTLRSPCLLTQVLFFFLKTLDLFLGYQIIQTTPLQKKRKRKKDAIPNRQQRSI